MAATVTTDPSGVRILVTVTCGGGGAAGTALAAWLAPGRVRAVGVAGARAAAEELAALARPDGPPACAGADDDVHAVVAPRPASARAVQNLRILNSRVPRVGRVRIRRYPRRAEAERKAVAASGSPRTIRSRCQAIRLPRQAA